MSDFNIMKHRILSTFSTVQLYGHNDITLDLSGFTFTGKTKQNKKNQTCNMCPSPFKNFLPRGRSYSAIIKMPLQKLVSCIRVPGFEFWLHSGF